MDKLKLAANAAGSAASNFKKVESDWRIHKMSNKLNNETSMVLAEINEAIKFHENELARLCKLRDDYLSNGHAMFADKLKSSMHEKNISQTALAELLGVSQKTISRYCTGVIIPSGEYQNHILSVLNNIKI